MSQYDSPDESTVHLENSREEAANLRGHVAELEKKLAKAEEEKTTREKWCAEVEKKLEDDILVINLDEYFTLIKGDYCFNARKHFPLTVYDLREFLKAALFYHALPTAFYEDQFMNPICVKEEYRGWFGGTNVYIVPTDEKLIIYEERI